MNLPADHPPIYAAQRESGMSLLARLMFLLAMAMWIVPAVMTLKVAG